MPEQDTSIEAIGTITDSIRQLLATDEEGANEYLAESFLTSAMLALFHARRQAGLTQAEVAERMHTKQSGIARMEADLSGSVSLRRYVAFARACGVLPLDITLVPAQPLREYTIEDSKAPRTADAYNAWRMADPSP
jgi:transcriptional regulator with XRE-family HTH domain